jgi:hypothetical protein
MKRRGSIVAPIILILIGGLFLANNLRPDIPMLEFLGRYWPFLLIAWGLVRLIEIVIWAVRGKPLPVSGVSAGEWVLVFFLTVLGTALHAFHTHVGWPPVHLGMRGIEMFGEAFDYAIDEKKVPAGKSKRLILDHLRGNTRIVGSDLAEVRVSGRKTVRSLSRDAANEIDRLTVLELTEQGDAILVRTNQSRAAEERFVTADLEISVPKAFTVEARGRDGEIDINDLEGGIDIDSDRAGVRVKNIGGNVRVNVRRSDIVRATEVKGELELQGRGGDVELDNIQGQVTIDGSWGGELHFRNLAKPLRYQGMQAELQIQKIAGEARLGRGYIQAESLQGPVIIRGRSKGCCDVRLTDFSSALELNVQRGDLELRPGMPVPQMDVEVRNGAVDLVLPPKAKFNLKAHVEKGEVDNEFGDPLRASDERRGGSITGGVADGPTITITSERGRISVRKGDGAPPTSQFSKESPLTPEPPDPPRVRRPEE